MGAVEDPRVLGVEILMYRYSGFPHGTMGMFLVSVSCIIRRCPVFHFCYFYFIFCSLPLRDDVIHMYHFCVLHLEYPL